MLFLIWFIVKFVDNDTWAGTLVHFAMQEISLRPRLHVHGYFEKLRRSPSFVHLFFCPKGEFAFISKNSSQSGDFGTRTCAKSATYVYIFIWDSDWLTWATYSFGMS